MFNPLRLPVLAFAFAVVAAPLGARNDWFTTLSRGEASVPLSAEALGVADALPGLRRVPVARLSQALAATDVPQTIPDNNTTGITSVIDAALAGTVTDVQVSYSITHPFRGDLRITLVAPSGRQVVLRDVTFDSTDDYNVANQSAATLAGESGTGRWQLKVADLASGDVGRLNSWSLLLTTNAASGPKAIDLVMSLTSNPAGDNNGNTQGRPDSTEQDKWERIVQYFADGIYEATNGAHVIGKVRIYRRGKNQSQCDVFWDGVNKGRPHVVHGVGEKDGRVNMFEIFDQGRQNADGSYSDYPLLNDEIGSGFTMAHEWGHYFYGLYDEYAKVPFVDIAVSPSIMSSQWDATNGDYRWLNFSIKRQPGTPLPNSFQNTERNVQHYVHSASSWETLQRQPTSDPLLARLLSLGKRIYYPEVAAAAPSGTATPAINLPNSAARGQLDIVWMSDELAYMIVIDNSGSMDGTAIQQARLAARLLVDKAVIGSARIGVLKFNTTVSTVFPLTAITTQAVKEQIKSAIDTITATGSTAIGDAAAAALPPLTALGTMNNARVVFLLSDGESNVGIDPLAVIPSYTAAKIPLFTFGFGSSVDAATLSQLATSTGGRYYSAPTSLAAITQAFDDANAQFADTPQLAEGSLNPSPTAPGSGPFVVDASVRRLQAAVTFSRAVATDTVSLRAPNGATLAPSSTSQTSTEKLFYFDLPTPASGSWQVVPSVQTTGARVNYRLSSITEGVTYNLDLATETGATTVAYPDPLVVRARLDRSLGVTNAVVSARVVRPDGTEEAVTLRDDGTGRDLTSGDGIYTLDYRYQQTGLHQFYVAMDNRLGSARLTYTGASACAVAGSPAKNGGAPPAAPDQPLTEAFSRSAFLQVTTTGGNYSLPQPRLANLSTRGFVGTGSNVLIAGFAVTGTAPKSVVVRAIGPTLASYGVTGTLANPRAQLFRADGTLVKENDDWGVGSDAAAIPAASSRVGAFALAAGSRDSVLLADLPPGNYSVQISGVAGGTGVALAEVYDAATTAAPRLINLSTRGFVGTGDQQLIAGFAVTGTLPKRVIVRAVGPALVPFGVTSALADPTLRVSNSSTGVLVAQNDDWGAAGSDQPAIIATSRDVGAFGLAQGSADSVLLLTLPPGNYSAQVLGKNGTTGIALVEVYEVPN